MLLLKKRLTQAPVSTDTQNVSALNYIKPLTYEAFQLELNEACSKADSDTKRLIEELAPEMATFLKAKNEWGSPTLTFDTKQNCPLNLYKEKEEAAGAHSQAAVQDIHDQLIDSLLGPVDFRFEFSNSTVCTWEH